MQSQPFLLVVGTGPKLWVPTLEYISPVSKFVSHLWDAGEERKTADGTSTLRSPERICILSVTIPERHRSGALLQPQSPPGGGN